MYSIWLTVLLTLTQALVAGAFPVLPIRQFFKYLIDRNCKDEYAASSNDILTKPGEFVETYAQQSNSSLYTSAVTIVDPSLSLHTIISTDLPSSQVPTITNASVNHPVTTGLIITTLQTDGNPPVPPFNTDVTTAEGTTLVPINTTGLPVQTTIPKFLTQTVTLPLTTYETVITTQTVITVPVQTTAVITQITVVNSTYTSDGSILTTSTVAATEVTTTGSVLVETTLSASITNTSTVTTVVTVDPTMLTPPVATSTSGCLKPMDCSGQDMFLPVDIVQPAAKFKRRAGHPVPRLGIQGMTEPIHTNKFYSNFFLGSQGFPAFQTPYSLTWSKGTGNAMSYGMAISHMEKDQKAFGPRNTQIPGQPISFYINPLGIQQLIISAKELKQQTVLKTSDLQMMTGRAHLLPFEGSPNEIVFPMASGSGFVTALFTNMKPWIQSSVFFRNVAAAPSPKNGVYKYRMTLEDGKVWLLYAIPDTGVNPNFQLISSSLMQGVDNWSGMIQVAKLPNQKYEALYDNSTGTYPVAGKISGYAKNNVGVYSLSWDKGGAYKSTAPLLMFALPHHIQSFTSYSKPAITGLQLNTVTKGIATAVSADYWSMQEVLPVTMGFNPWRAPPTTFRNLSRKAIAAIQPIAALEASQDVSAQTNLNSMYYSGKGLSKFATLAYTMHELTDQKDLASALLVKLKAAFNVFAQNQQQFPLLYDTDWKGLVSSASYVTGDSGMDFGNSYYNDHHFHNGYFIHAAAIIGYLDPSWIPANKDFVNALVRDTSNPSSKDQYFPVFRSFDPYNGHSWAKGLYETGDGKDQESSSEDAMYAYGLKMWGRTVGDKSMEARGNLMLAILSRSLRNYFLMDSSNVNQPSEFIANKVTGILFENKADHVTYFGTNPEYIQGIQMIPLLPFSTYTRQTKFVREEWDAYFSDNAFNPAKNVQGGWKGLLFANLAIINPVDSYKFFSQPSFDNSWLDGGATRAWYMAFAAGIGGGPV